MNKTQIQKQLIKETKYSKWYLDIIYNIQSQNRSKKNKLDEDYKYYEKHHILPQSIFEEYSNLKNHKWNGVLLTKKEHRIAHYCLYKHYKKLDNPKATAQMKKGYLMMKSTNHYYSEGWTRGKPFSTEHIKKLSEAKQGNKHNMYGIPRTNKTKQKISESLKGHDTPANVRNKISETLLANHPMRGIKQKTLICPHCNKEGGYAGMHRWHFNNCNNIK